MSSPEPPVSDSGPPESSPQSTSRGWLWVLITVVAILIVCGLTTAVCYGGGVLLPRYVADGTATASAVLAAPPADWQIAMDDPFDYNANNWSFGSHDEDWGRDIRQFEDGLFIWNFLAGEGGLWSFPRPVQVFGDFYLAVEAQRIAGSPEATMIGVVFRKQDNQHFAVFEINDYGYFSVFVYDMTEWVELIPWTATEATRYDGMNLLTVLAEGTHFYFFVNDELVGEIVSSEIPPTGQIGLFVDPEEDQEGSVQFDNLAIYEP